MITLAEALETLELLPDWEQRYTFLIELARQLPPMPPGSMVPAHLVKGCTSQVWLTHQWQGGQLQLQLNSDALIVKGLLALVWLAYHQQTAAQILSLPLTQQLQRTQLVQHLSPNRRNGLASVIGLIQSLASNYTTA